MVPQTPESLINIGLLLQILTLLVAAVGPVLAYRFARKLSLSENRQKWLDSFRDDVAELLALRDALALHLADPPSPERKQAIRELPLKIQNLRFRIHLRLRTGNPLHDDLRSAILKFLRAGNEDSEERNVLREEICCLSEAIVQRVWMEIQTGRKAKQIRRTVKNGDPGGESLPK